MHLRKEIHPPIRSPLVFTEQCQCPSATLPDRCMDASSSSLCLSSNVPHCSENPSEYLSQHNYSQTILTKIEDFPIRIHHSDCLLRAQWYQNYFFIFLFIVSLPPIKCEHLRKGWFSTLLTRAERFIALLNRCQMNHSVVPWIITFSL